MKLESHVFFSFFAEGAVARIIEASQVKDYAEGVTVFDEGGEADSIYLVLEGDVAIRKADTSGQEQIIAHVGPNDYFGEFGVLDGLPRSAGAVADQPSRLARVSKDDLLELLRHSPPDSIIRLAAHSINKFRETNERYVEDRLRRERMSLVGEMASEIIHDFKNPFTVICLVASTLNDKYKDEATNQSCRLIEGQIRRMELMANELLEFSRGRTHIHTERFNLSDLFERFDMLNRDYLTSSGVELVLKGADLWMEADIGKLLRVIQNLVNNAAESFKGENGTITVEALPGDDQLEIRVSDTGPGIPEEVRARLFEAFATFGKKKGTGLGMAIAKSIVEAHGGRIWFETEIGKGTTFFIVIPLKRPGGAA